MHIPIIGNGDITTPQRAQECFDLYGVDAIMIGLSLIHILKSPQEAKKCLVSQ